MGRIVCALCKFENNGRCVEKNATVKLNKRRACSFYQEDENKLNFVKKRQNELSLSQRPDWFWDRKEYVKERKRIAAEENAKGIAITNDQKHPLTGDLSRFIKSTVSEETKD